MHTRRYATLGADGAWTSSEVASGGYFNRIAVVGSTPIIVFQVKSEHIEARDNFFFCL